MSNCLVGEGLNGSIWSGFWKKNTKNKQTKKYFARNRTGKMIKGPDWWLVSPKLGNLVSCSVADYQSPIFQALVSGNGGISLRNTVLLNSKVASATRDPQSGVRLCYKHPRAHLPGLPYTDWNTIYMNGVQWIQVMPNPHYCTQWPQYLVSINIWYLFLLQMKEHCRSSDVE